MIAWLCEVDVFMFWDAGQASMKPDIIVPEAPREVLPLITSSNMKLDKKKELKLIETQHLRHTVSDLSLAADDLIIPWNELVLKEKIGAGICVHIILESSTFSSHQQSGGKYVLYVLTRIVQSILLEILSFFFLI